MIRNWPFLISGGDPEVSVRCRKLDPRSVSSEKIGWMVGFYFITNNVCQLVFLVNSSMLPPKHNNSGICEVHLQVSSKVNNHTFHG